VVLIVILRTLVTGLVLGLAGAPVVSAEAIAEADSLESRLSALIPKEMERRHLVGAVLTVVDRDHVVFARGYGVADLDSGTPVFPDRTTFRVASVSKLLTAVALMKLVEQGQIDLNQDVDAHLAPLQVSDDFAQPITAWHLLTHTSGLSERFLDSRSRRRSDLVPLGTYLAHRLPPRFIAPGVIISYANHNMALAGFLVESVGGLPFPDAVRQGITHPLAMERSGFGMEPALLDELAQGYVFSAGSYHRIPVDFRSEVPSGSFVTTGDDMARFLRMLLNGGALDGVRILDRATVDSMMTRQFSHDPAMLGVGLGFWELEVDGRHYWGHDGDIVGWNARAVIDPERGVALFLAYTGTDTVKAFADQVTTAVFREADTRHWRPRRPRVARSREDLRGSGLYRWTRTVRRTPDRLFTPYWLVQYRVRVLESGELELTNPLGLFRTSRWEPVAGGLFQEVDGSRLLSFREDAGRITHLLLEGPIPMAFERIPWCESIPVQVGMLVIFLVGFLAIAGVTTIRLLRSPARSAGAPMAFASATNALFLLAFPPVMGLNMYFSDLLPLPEILVPPGDPAFFYGMPVTGLVLLALPLLGLASTGLAGIRWFSARKQVAPSWNLGLAVPAFLLFEAGFVVFLQYWRMFGWEG
jgi:CubicO group peptidase (beta-lactamase class C family)